MGSGNHWEVAVDKLTSISTIEFLIKNVIPESWFDDLTRVWNESIFILNWLQHYKRAIACNATDVNVEIKIKKVDNDWVYFCDIARDFRIDKTKSWDKENIETRPCVNLVNSKWLTPPPIDQVNAIALRKCFAKKRCEWLKGSDTPSVYINDFVGLVVIPAWEAYQKGQRGKPKYKHKHKVDTISCASFRSQCHALDGNKLKLPGMEIEVRGLRSRLLNKIEKMVEGMRANPRSYPRLQEKVKKLTSEKVGKLIKDEGKIRKELSEEEIKSFTKLVNKLEVLESAIAYFSSPGSFRLVKREGKTYLQISAEVSVTAAVTRKEVGVDIGLDLLCHTTSGLKVKHQDFTKELARIDTLNQHLAKMKYGSNNYNKLLNKIRKIQGKIKRSKKGKQAYVAQQIADVNQAIAVKKIRVKDTIENPLPKTNGARYLRNGKAEATLKNREIHDCAIGQFVSKLTQQVKKKSRDITFVEVEVEATPEEVAELADLKVVASHRGEIISIASPPPIRTTKKRNKRREKAIP